ncbi:curli-like amyloid fiber formation chaperone CsgH [Methylobacterium gregans]|uniref:CsgH-like domain-containing protein n=1 Tax=Methylobacterium gregans TaxID=374424 RepID=A0AA37HME8_9HYPH|nr:hypothetical protein NBEOAGPD_1464 [Methylobacterium gregans]GLS55533.1 hypothetical protein GCM10007886_37180 [Methylobacterium gregans]
MVVSAEVPPPISCALVEQRVGAQVRISVQIRSDAERVGIYRLQVIKQGPSGDSRISQQSKFALDAGRSMQIQGLSLSMEPSAHYRAVLSVSSGGATYVCERTGPGGADDL